MYHRFSLACCLLLACVLPGCAPEPSPQSPLTNPSSDPPQQTVTALTQADQKRLRDQRAVVERHLSNQDSRQKYKTAAGKLGTLRALLEANVFKPQQTYELQSLGVVLGDAFVQELGMEWVIVEDADGRDPAIRMPNTSIILYPTTMISKRVERGERVDVFELFNGVAAQVDDLQRQSR